MRVKRQTPDHWHKEDVYYLRCNNLNTKVIQSDYMQRQE
jgi:hypothetical protein